MASVITHHSSPITASRHPVGEKDIKLTRSLGPAVRYPNQAGTIWRKHGETIELSVECEPFKALAILADRVEMKAGLAALTFRFNV